VGERSLQPPEGWEMVCDFTNSKINTVIDFPCPVDVTASPVLEREGEKNILRIKFSKKSALPPATFTFTPY
jgi:hypothetical protein